MKQIKWIAVEERLPETDNVVLVAISPNKTHLIGYELSRYVDGKWWTENARNAATHWCPIPEGPLPWLEVNTASFPEGTKVKIVPNFFGSNRQLMEE